VVLNALSAFAALTATLLVNASASASVRMYALWYPSTNSGQGAVVANSGATIGGQFAVRVVVQPEPGEGSIITASVTQQSIRELTNAHAVTSGQLAEFQRVNPDPQYGDPTSNVVVLESPFVNFAGHNATYQIDVTVSYLVQTNNPPPNDRRTVNSPPVSMTLTMSNLLLVDSRPEPYFVWKPDEMTGVVFSAQLQHAQAGTCTVKLEIFRREDNQNPIFAPQFDGVSRPGSWSWTWDGRLDDGTVAPAGVYVYRLGAYIYGSAPPDRDSNRSDYLFIERAVDENNEPMLYAEYWGYDDRETPEDETDDEHLYFIRWYVLKDSLNTNAHRGEIWLFDPELQRIGTWDLAQLPCVEHNHQPDGLTASASGVKHGVLVRVPVSLMVTPGEYLFMVHAVDDHVAEEKHHRRKPALPLNAQLHMEIDKVRVYYRNLTERSRAYPFTTDTIALRAIVWVRTRQGYYAFCGMGFRNSSSEWFENDGYWFATGTDGDPIIWEQDSLPRLDPAQRVYRWPGGIAISLSWYRLVTQVDKETELTDRQKQGADPVYRYYPPYMPLHFGWGTDSLQQPGNGVTVRFAVRLSWTERTHSGVAHMMRYSYQPTPGDWLHPNIDEDNAVWSRTWSQNCDERTEYAVRISFRHTHATSPDARKQAFLQWVTSFRVVPYEWGGHWYGGRSDNQADRSPGSDGYDGYGIDCSGLVCAAARLAGYNWNPWRTNVTGLCTDYYSRRIADYNNNLQPGDILAYPGHHVVIVYRYTPGTYDVGPGNGGSNQVIDACGQFDMVHVHPVEKFSEKYPDDQYQPRCLVWRGQ